MKKLEGPAHQIAQILCDGIKISLGAQLSKVGKEIKKAMHWKTYAKNFCTVQFRTARQSGHTHAIRLILESHLFAQPVVLSVLPVERTRIAMNAKQYPGVRIGSMSTLPRFVEGLRGMVIPVVFIDGATNLKAADVEAIYDHFEPWVVGQKTILFVFLN